MAIKEFVIGPQSYFEENYFSGDYTESNVSRSFLECDVDNIKGGRVVTGEYYEDNYIDGTYFHNNSMAFQMVVEAMVVQDVTVNISNYFQDSYYESGYFRQGGSRFTLTIELGTTVEAIGAFQVQTQQSIDVDRIRIADAGFDASFTQTTANDRIREPIGNDGIGTTIDPELSTNEFQLVITANKISDVNVSMSAEFSQAATISHIEGADLFAFSEAAMAALVSRSRDYAASLDDIFDVATDYVRFRTATAEADALFTQSADGARSRDFDSQIEAAVSFESTVGIIKDVTADITGIASTLAIVGEIIDIGTNVGGNIEPITLSATFSLSANAQIPTRVISFEVFEEPYYDELLFSTDKKFGSHSLRLDGVQGEVYPGSVVWNGSQHKSFTQGYTFTANNPPISWTKQTNNLQQSGEVDYQNNLYIIKSFNNISYSSDGINWTSFAINITNYQSQGGYVLYSGGYWYTVARDYGGTTYVYRNSSLQSTGWTSYIFISQDFNVNGVKRYGTSLVFAGGKEKFLGASDNTYAGYRISPGGGTSSVSVVTSSTNPELVYDFAYDGTNIYFLTLQDTTYRIRRNNETSALQSASRTTYGIVSIDYEGGHFFTNRTTVNKPTSGMYISDSGFSITAPSTIEYQVSRPKFVNSRAILVNNPDYSGFGEDYAGVTSNKLVFTVTDFIDYAQVEVDTIEGVNSSRVEYRDNSFANWKTVDFWTKSGDSIYTNAYARPLSIGESYIETYNSSNARYLGIGSTNTFNNNLASTVNFGNWTHIRLLRNGTQIKGYVNGNAVGTITYTFDDNTLFRIMSGTNIGASDVYVDEFLISSEFLNPFADNSFTVPTQPWANDDDRLLLLHFDNSYEDDAEPAFEASLSSNFAVSALAGKTVNAEVEFESIASTLSAINVIGDTLVDFESVVTISNIDFDRIRDNDSDIGASATVDVDGIRIKQLDSSLVSEFSLSAAVGSIEQFAFDESAFASLSADVNINAQAQADITSQASLIAGVGTIPLIDTSLAAIFEISVDATSIKAFDSSMASEFAVSADAIKAVNAQADISSETSVSAQAQRFRDVETDFESIASNLTAASKIGDFFINMESQFQQTTNAKILAQGSVPLEVISTLDAQESVTRTFDAGLTSSVVVEATARLTTDVASDFEVETQQVTGAVKTAKGEASVNSAMEFQTVVVATRNNEIQTFTVSTLTADVGAVRGVEIDMQGVAESTISAQRIRQTSSNQTVSCTLSAQVRKLVILENLEYAIRRETREYVIPREVREYKIKGA